MKNLGRALLVIFALLLLTPETAHAYLDMGTGSYILQVLVASLASGAVFIKIFWSRIISFFSRNKSEKVGKSDNNETKHNG